MEEEMDVEEPAGQAQLNAAPVVELLAIQEDPVAHLLLKKILLLEVIILLTPPIYYSAG